MGNGEYLKWIKVGLGVAILSSSSHLKIGAKDIPELYANNHFSNFMIASNTQTRDS